MSACVRTTQTGRSAIAAHGSGKLARAGTRAIIRYYSVFSAGRQRMMALLGRSSLYGQRDKTAQMAANRAARPTKNAANALRWRRYLVAGVGFEPTTFRL
jgi:hypothetical protein